MITRQVLRSFLPKMLQLQSTSVILRAFAIEMYKIWNDLSPPFIKDMMTEISIPYNTRSTTKVEKDDEGNYSCFKNPTTSSQLLKRFPMDLILLDI